jgi:predicted Fe-Mo cluster-binding NifX family protein
VKEMKFAIPVEDDKGWNSKIGYHFGRVPFFVIWDEKENSVNTIENRSSHRGGAKLPAEFLADHCNGILCSGIGSRAITLCQQHNVRVFMGATGTVEETVNLYKAGKLKEANPDEGCQH